MSKSTSDSSLRITSTFCDTEFVFDVDVMTAETTIPDEVYGLFHQDLHPFLAAQATLVMVARLDDSKEGGALSRAFGVVSDANDWKAPIRTICYASDLVAAGVTIHEVCEAVRFYTGTVADLTHDVTSRGIQKIHVDAVGYRMGPAGDH